MIAATEQNIKKQLQLVAKERNLTPAAVWQNIICDRFLVRLCQSPYRLNFVLKGGILLAKRIDIGRETKDLDFAVEELKNDVEVISRAIEEIIKIEVNDGFEFRAVKVDIMNHFHVNYPGAQIRVDVGFGQNQFSLFIDLGFGDYLKVKEENIALTATAKGPLFETDIKLACTPLEFVFAEKLETVVYRGAESSRLKDFHDLISMIESHLLDKQNTLHAVKVIFEHRSTPLKLPIEFDATSLQMLQNHWQRYRKSLSQPDSVSANIEEIIQTINAFICLEKLL